MEELSLLGNAAAVPFIIATTQLLKKNFSFRYKADVLSLIVAFIICPGWWFYTTPETEIWTAFSGGFVKTTKFLIDMLLISVATWLSATKSYDLFRGNKKRETERKELLDHKEELLAKIKSLEAEHGDENNEENNKDVEITDKLLEILEGRN